ncbi:hypothetical protein B5S30_g1380 [[Candida] boidinii]|nr:hypothetical protein B5S30_g1380 [[Candida] boidinii]
MKILAAAEETGSLKEIVCVRGTDTSKQASTQPEAINNYCQESRATKIEKFIIYKDKYIVAARTGGDLCFYNLADYELVNKFSSVNENPKDKFCSIFVNKTDGYVYICTEAGKVSIFDPENLNKKHRTFKLTAPVQAFISDDNRKGTFAYGGKENDLKVIKFSKETDIFKVKGEIKFDTVFKAKNVSNNKLDLRVPIWISRIAFIANEPEEKEDVYKLVTVTRHGQVRSYNSTKSRKPTLDFSISKNPLLTLIVSDKKEIIVSDSHTTTAKFDFTNGSLLGKFTGAVGSIQASFFFSPSNVIATGGLDRYVRVFNIKSRETLVKCFMGTQITDVAILEDEKDFDNNLKSKKKGSEKKHSLEEEGNTKEVADDEDDNDDDEDDEEELWAKLESNIVEKRKRRKL